MTAWADNLTFRPMAPLALWATLALCVAGLLVRYFFVCRTKVGVARALMVLTAMGLSAAGPLVVLLNPTWLEPLPPPPDKPLLSIVVDRSPSMSTCDDGVSRYSVAKQHAEELVDQLDDQFDVRLLTFSEAVREAGLDNLVETADEAGSTNLTGALDEALRSRRFRGAGVVLLSDGAHTLAGGVSPVLDVAERARALATPIYTCTIGGQVAAPNLSTSFHVAQELAYIDQQAPLGVVLKYQSLAGRSAKVVLTLADAATGQPITVEEKLVQLDETGAAEVSFLVKQSETGLYQYRVEGSVEAEEATLSDNRASMLLRVVDEPIRLAILEGKPYWDSKFLLRNLAADPSTAVVSYVRMGPSRCMKRTLQAPGDKEDPSREESWEIVADAKGLLGDRKELADFQVLVLGRDIDALLDENDVESIRDWVAYQGGSLVCARGAPTSEVGQRLNELLPVHWTAGVETRFRVGLTDVARELRSLGATDVDTGGLAGMPSLAAATQVRRTRPMTTVLAESTDGDQARPVIAYHPFGSGVVVSVEGAGMWRWAFLPPDHAEHDNVYGRVWSTLIRWLVSRSALLPGQQFALAMDKIAFSTDEIAVAQLLTSDRLAENDVPKVRLTGGELTAPLEIQSQGGIRRSDAYRLTLGALPAGSYTLEAISATDPENSVSLMFDVRDPYREQLDLNARPELMRRLAERSGGAAIKSSDDLVERVREQFDGYLTNANPPQFSQTEAWDRPWVLVLMLSVWAASWTIRRRVGLL